jgi:hypothetical protein
MFYKKKIIPYLILNLTQPRFVRLVDKVRKKEVIYLLFNFAYLFDNYYCLSVIYIFFLFCNTIHKHFVNDFVRVNIIIIRTNRL